MTTPEDYTLEQLAANRDEAHEEAKYAPDFLLANAAYTAAHAAWYAASKGKTPDDTDTDEWLGAWVNTYLERADQTLTDYLN